MSSAASATSTSLVEAINFLTHPLALSTPKSTINSLQQILLSTLTTVPAWLRNTRLTLTFSSAAPPRAIYAACIATNLDWSGWFYALGGREFDLTIERTLVTVQVTGVPGRAVVWKQPPARSATFIPTIALSEPEPKVQVPISKFSQSVKLNTVPPPIAVNPPPVSTQSKTLAQQILQSEHENEEADEIFAMISSLSACLISPTPTRERFDIPNAPVARTPIAPRFTHLSTLEEEVFHSHSSFRHVSFAQDRNTPSPVSSSDSSRPSSPLSSFSFSSSQESLTSVSTTSSPTSSPIKTFTRSFISPAKRESPRHERAPQAVVNTPKKQVQRYLYQGGQSTVLTGGVMLGASAKKTTVTSAPGYRAPLGAKKGPGLVAQAKPQPKAGSTSKSGPWRPAMVSRV
ncbi:hypothetical protein P691DRAFT_802648 [Macrolepiota fuliginosa MF-IS2]|uniref:Anti-proliferative protein domain-containing protein n=1 Tax=Macrolepiota fuliginosa MF-IS2 TaxID=1400762 RepID=A0A9P6C3A6_9AGAR|nr:hypothetical protein P691DRAFT_802648 [Macrolepiota fuliginosa MF-IS2]